MLNLLCKVGFHYGTWVYDSDAGQSAKCDQTRICRCGVQNFRVEHTVSHWESDGFFSDTKSGVCIRCKQLQNREREPTFSFRI